MTRTLRAFVEIGGAPFEIIGDGPAADDYETEAVFDRAVDAFVRVADAGALIAAFNELGRPFNSREITLSVRITSTVA